MEKLKKIFWGIVITASIIITLIPQVGSLVMLEEIIKTIFMLCIGVGCIVLMVGEKINRQNIKGILSAALIIGVCGWFVVSGIKDIAMDITAGTETVTLYQCQVTKQSTYKGIVSLHYYLTGETSEGEKYRLEVNGRAMDELKGKNVVRVTCYKHMGRVVSY